ncbi:putative RNA-directed DNA polymerase, eukaryota, reverse transcriptase zinc-binding domain protein, partial [Tanacetum coccineum]
LLAFNDAGLLGEKFLMQKARVEWMKLVFGVSDQEIYDAIFAMGENKAPGPDGYTAAFFKEAWDIISNDVVKEIKEFFTNRGLLKEVNHTILALISKVNTPMRINDYLPLSCCNVLYKCISRIISNRMKESLMKLVSLNQSAFVPGRRIFDNILLTDEVYFSFGRHLDELHVTWAHLEKKRMRLRTNAKTLEKLCSQSLETE